MLRLLIVFLLSCALVERGHCQTGGDLIIDTIFVSKFRNYQFIAQLSFVNNSEREIFLKRKDEMMIDIDADTGRTHFDGVIQLANIFAAKDSTLAFFMPSVIDVSEKEYYRYYDSFTDANKRIKQKRVCGSKVYVVPAHSTVKFYSVLSVEYQKLARLRRSLPDDSNVVKNLVVLMDMYTGDCCAHASWYSLNHPLLEQLVRNKDY